MATCENLHTHDAQHVYTKKGNNKMNVVCAPTRLLSERKLLTFQF
jgi:hypothetical protein